jgi:hypothetical protein
VSEESCPHCGKGIATDRPYAVTRCSGCAALLQLENGRIVRSAPAGTNPMSRPHTNPGMKAMKAPLPEHELDREFEHELELDLHVEVPKPESSPPRPNGHAAPSVVNLADDHRVHRFTRRKLVLAAAAGGAVVLALVLMLSFSGDDPVPVPNIAPVAAPTPPPAPAPAPAAAPTPVAPPEPAPAAPTKRTLGGVPVVLEYDKAPGAAAPPAAGTPPAPQPVDQRAIPRARAAYQRGNNALFAGQPEVAISHYQESLRIYPGYVAGHRGLGLAYAEKGQNPEAIRHMRTYIRAVPNAKDVPLLKKRIQRLESVLNRRK